jgi:hypothetical protein
MRCKITADEFFCVASMFLSGSWSYLMLLTGVLLAGTEILDT